MHASSDYSRSTSGRGPAMYYGYCSRTKQYRMMDLPDYMNNMQQGMSQLMNNATSMYGDMAQRYYGPMMGQGGGGTHGRASRDCRCDDCHCECCVCDADVLVHARCGEVRRIPVTFENDTRHERQVKLTIEKFLSAGGRDLGWEAKLSEAEFTLRGCDEHTVIVTVVVRCEAFQTGPAGEGNAAVTVDRCEVGYGTLRAEGCLVRPIILAIAVLPDDCDACRRPCGCDCCH